MGQKTHSLNVLRVRAGRQQLPSLPLFFRGAFVRVQEGGAAITIPSKAILFISTGEFISSSTH